MFKKLLASIVLGSTDLSAEIDDYHDHPVRRLGLNIYQLE